MRAVDSLRPLPERGGHARRDTRDERTWGEGSAYREFRPPPQLRDHVVCFWRREAGETASAAAIIPDGCIDVIWRTGGAPMVAGPMTVPFHAASEAGTAFAGIRFRPGVGSHLLGVSARELRDRHLPLRSIWSHQEISRWEAVSADEPGCDAIASMIAAVAHQLRSLPTPDPFVIAATSWLAGHPFGPVDTLRRFSGLSDRQIRRRFDDAIGYGPKTLQRVMRLQYLLWLASQRPSRMLGLAQLALAAGFADQPHMTREVAALTGASPRNLLASAPRSAVAPLFHR